MRTCQDCKRMKTIHIERFNVNLEAWCAKASYFCERHKVEVSELDRCGFLSIKKED